MFTGFATTTVTRPNPDCTRTCETCDNSYDCSYDYEDCEDVEVYDYTSLEEAWCVSDISGKLLNATNGDPAPGAHGTLNMQQGEKIFKNRVEPDTYKEYPETTVNGYPVTASNDAESYRYVYRSVTWNGGTPVEHDNVIAVMNGGKAGKMNSSGVGTCCYDCDARHQPEFANSAGTAPHCTQNGTDGQTILNHPNFTTITTLPKEEGLYINLDKFTYYVGCHGQAGEVKAAMFPSTGTRGFKFEVGKGGKVNKQGGESSFGWIRAMGGLGANEGCYSDTTDVNSPSVVNTDKRLNTVGTDNVGNGGIAGDIIIYGDGLTLDKYGLPLRNYEIPREADKEPNGRWGYDNSKTEGSTGMVVVSW